MPFRRLADALPVPNSQLILAFSATYAPLTPMSMYYSETCIKLSKYYHKTTAVLATNILLSRIITNPTRITP